tara:strand:+ start:555 stop:815 length:261 start_codon:yes stop_codon:yes gene_type:complete
MRIDKLQAIVKINPNAQVTVIDDNYDTIIWGDTPVIPLADIEAKIAELQPIEDAKAQAKIDNKASAKAKLIAGEALTEDEANTIVL